VKTPLIPFSGSAIKISLEVSSDTKAPFILTTEFFNKYKFLINVKLNNGEMTPEAKLTEIYAAGDEIVTDIAIAKNKGIKLGLNPSFGHADPVVETMGESTKKTNGAGWVTKITKSQAHLIPGTPVTEAEDFNGVSTKETSKEWQTVAVEINRESLPEGTDYVGLTIENKTANPILIREVKVKRKKTE
jgi:hypothetical protein